MSTYDINKIAQELKDTAQGLCYYGNALLVCLDFPIVADNPEYKAVVTRYLRGRGAIESTDHVTLYEIAIKLQEQRCPYPVHLWGDDWELFHINPIGEMFARINGIDYPITLPPNHKCPREAYGKSWTRSEALASQMLDKPDKVGVWVIYEEYATIVDNIKDLTTTAHYDECDGSVLYESVKGLWGSYSVLGNKFYFMGPLPTSNHHQQ